jgi:tetratricopeptide (TPR) repeat protein
LAKEITGMLRMRLTGDDEKRMAKSHTANPEAYQDYLKGRYWWDKATEAGYNKGIEYFQQAIQKDPAYALAYSGLATAYNGLGGSGFVPTKEAYPRAKGAAQKALEIDDTLAEAHTALAFTKMFSDWDWSGGETEIQRAIKLNPGSMLAHGLHGVELLQMGRLEPAIAEVRRAAELDPLSPVMNRALGTTLLFARQYDQAIQQERKTLELDPNFALAHDSLGMAYLQKSMYREGIGEFEKMLVTAPGSALALSDLGYGYALAGRKADAQKALEQLNELSKHKYVPAVYLARIYAGLGDKDKAFEWLEKSYDDRTIAGAVTFIKVDPLWDALRSDPRFQDLLRRMNLQP